MIPLACLQKNAAPVLVWSIFSVITLGLLPVDSAEGADYVVEVVNNTGSVTSIGQSQDLLDNPGTLDKINFTLPNLNLNGEAGGGNFANDDAFPYADTFALRARLNLSVESTGTYTFGVNSDDGVRLSIDGSVLINDDVLRAAENSFQTTTLDAGDHVLELIYFENTGAANLELFAAPGNHTSFSSVFTLLGDTLHAPPGQEIEGAWGPVLSWPLVAVSMANLPDGRILTYSGSERRTWPSTERTFSATWDPLTGQFDETLHLGHNMFCGAMSMLEDGTVFVNGGRNQQNSPWTSLYDYQSGNWSRIENMASGGRWYPTTLAMGNGDIFTAMGVSTNVRNPELWSPATGWRVLNGIDFLNLRQRRNELGRENVFPLLSQAPNGSIYHFWDTVENHHISTTGNGSAAPANPDTDHHDHAGGVQVMYDEGQLLISGNNDGSWGGNSSVVSSDAFTVDLTGATPEIRATQSMNYQRKFHQLITLPTGEVLVVGGNTTGSKFQDDGSVLHSEIWNPQTGTWRITAPMSVPRDYHSTALLMIDGRVITAGGGYHPSDPSSGGTHQDAQIYSPPYLFSPGGQPANRPTVVADFTEIGYGQEFGVTTSGNIDYFSLVKMSATTHAINTDARFFKPQFQADGSGRFLLSMHGNANVATPGYWMLFAVDSSGVPSIAEIIRVSEDGGDPNNGQPPVVEDVTSEPVASDQSVIFDVNATGIGLLYSWNFGDGSGDTAFSSQSSASHNFSEPGRYVVNVTVRDPAGLETVTTYIQLVHAQLTATRPVISAALAEITSRNELWNVNPDNNSVAAVSTTGLNRLAVVNVGDNPRSLALAPDGRLWVVNKDSATISVVDPAARSVQQTFSLDTGSRPHGIVMAGNRAYVALEGLEQVVQFNAATGAELRRASAGNHPRQLSVSADGSRLYVSSFITPPLPGESGANPSVSGQGGLVQIFDIGSSTLAADGTVRLGHINRNVTEFHGPGLPNYLGPVVISPDGQRAWVPSKQDNILAGSIRGGAGMTFDQTVRAVTSLIDLSSETEIRSSRVDHDNASVASHAAFGPYGLTLFTSLEGNRQIAVIDAYADTEIARFNSGGRAPQSLLVSEDGERLYAHNFMERTVSIFDVGAIVNQGDTAATLLASVDVTSSESLSSTELRGKRLFYDARDDRLAALDYMSCASCHNEAGGDGRTWDFSNMGEGLRHTINLLGAGGMDNGLLHWSANFDELQDFEGQIRSFAGGTGLMSNADFSVGTRSEPLGLPKAGISPDLDALAAYLQSLDQAPPSPYRNADGSLSSQASNGRTLFASKGCVGCHSGENFTDSSTTLNLHDIGSLDSQSGSRLSGPLNGIDTPTLLGAWFTAPYLHDGSASSLADAISAHNTVTLSNSERADLAEFVRQLSPAEAFSGGTAPTISIVAPADGAVVNDDESVTFDAIASDNEDGDLASSVSWSSDIDGDLGSGSVTTLLSTGEHSITASVSDSDGLSATDTIGIEVIAGMPGDIVSIQSTIDTGINDAEERTNGRVKLTSADLELIFDASNGEQVVGLRFTTIAVPAGAQISNAYIQFTADETDSGATSLTLAGQAVNDAAAFRNVSGDVSGRLTTSATVSWSPQAWNVIGESGARQRTPDLRLIIQEIVSRPGWQINNALAIIISGSGQRVAEAFEGSAAGAARLHIDYVSDTTGGTDTDQDGIPDATDPDDDNDGFDDVNDAFPLNANEWLDTDNDGLGNNADTDDDNDNVPDSTDDFPLDPNEWLDTDGDGIGNNADDDDDNDGTPDDLDPAPLDPDVGGGNSTTVESFIVAGSDDAEQRASGRVKLTSTDLEIVFDADGNQIVGLRFTEVDVPQGASIVNAYVQFQAGATNSIATDLSISGDASNNAATYRAIDNNISDRTSTSASVSWSPAPWTQVGQVGALQRTPNLSPVISEIVSRPGWSSGNALAIMISGTGERVAESFEGNPTAAPLLHIAYSATGGGNSRPTVSAGANQTIPVSGTAVLDGTVTDDGLPMPPGSVTVDWARVSGPGSVSFADAGSATTTATFSQAGIYVLELNAFDSELSGSDRVTITVTDNSGATVVESRVASRNDDAEEQDDGVVYLSSSDLELGREVLSLQLIGLRFTGLDIPQNATITRAYIQFQVDEITSEATDLLLQAENSDDANPFSTAANNVSSRPRTSASVAWSPPPWNTEGEAGPDQQTTDVSTVIQEVVNRSGWSANNAMVILVSGTGKRTAESFDGTGAAPLLHVEYQ